MKVLNFTKIKVEECEDLSEKIWREGRIFGEDGPAIFILERKIEMGIIVMCVCNLIQHSLLLYRNLITKMPLGFLGN